MTDKNPVKILNVPVHPLTMKESVDYLEQQLIAGKKSFVVTANAEIIMMCQSNKEYFDIVANKADLVLPDGAGAVWAGRFLGYNVPERVAGFDLFNELLKLSAEKKYKIYFLGGAKEIPSAAKAKAEKLYPGVQIVGYHDGYFKDNETTAIVDEINRLQTDILFVALGAPKQEKWLIANKESLNAKVLMGIGGSFDVLAGKMERAPKWMQDASLEWAFRLYKQPSRFMRMLALPKFVIKVIFSKL